MIVDISKVTLENLDYYRSLGTPKTKGLPRGKNVVKRNNEDKKKYLKEYQHKYYMEVTKIKREKKKLERS